MKVLYGLAAAAVILFVAVQLYDRHARRSVYWRIQHQQCVEEVMGREKDRPNEYRSRAEWDAWLQEERQKASEFCDGAVEKALQTVRQ